VFCYNARRLARQTAYWQCSYTSRHDGGVFEHRAGIVERIAKEEAVHDREGRRWNGNVSQVVLEPIGGGVSAGINVYQNGKKSKFPEADSQPKTNTESLGHVDTVLAVRVADANQGRAVPRLQDHI